MEKLIARKTGGGGRFRPCLSKPIRGFVIVLLVHICACAPTASHLQQAGNAYFMQGHYDSAIEKYNEDLKLDPNDATAYYNRGTSYVAKEQYARAIDDFTEAIRLWPEYTKAYLNRGSCYAEA